MMYRRIALIVAIVGSAPLGWQQAEADRLTYFGSGFSIPDNNGAGNGASIVVADSGPLTNVSITINLSHTWVGDLIATLTRDDGVNPIASVDLLHRTGKSVTDGSLGDSSNVAGNYTFADSASGDFPVAAAALGSDGIIPAGDYLATTNIFSGSAATTNPTVSINAVFSGLDRSGTWTLHISDNAVIDTGGVETWSLALTTRDQEVPTEGVPEPSTLALATLALAGLGFLVWRRVK